MVLVENQKKWKQKDLDTDLTNLNRIRERAGITEPISFQELKPCKLEI